VIQLAAAGSWLKGVAPPPHNQLQLHPCVAMRIRSPASDHRQQDPVTLKALVQLAPLTCVDLGIANKPGRSRRQRRHHPWGATTSTDAGRILRALSRGGSRAFDTLIVNAASRQASGSRARSCPSRARSAECDALRRANAGMKRQRNVNHSDDDHPLLHTIVDSRPIGMIMN